MDRPIIQANKIKKKENRENPKPDIKKNLSIKSNEYCAKKFGSVILRNKNIYLDINKLLSKNQKSILNQSILSRKGSSINKPLNKTNSLSNSNILLKSTEENLLQSINNNEDMFSKKSLKNLRKVISKKDSKKSLNKLEGRILKNVIKFYRKFFSKENEIIENDEDYKPRSSTKIINIKLIEEIEKERNKILEEQKKHSALQLQSESNISSLAKGPNKNSFFQFGIKSKKANNFKINSSIGTFKRKKKDISNNKDLQIKSLKKINSDISRQITGSSAREVKKEIKDLEKLDITDIIKKTKSKNKLRKINRQSLYDSSFNFDISKIKENKREEAIQKRFRHLFSCKNLYDSLDDDENEDLDKMPIFFIGPNDPLCYIIDSMTLIISIISLINIPYFLAFSLNECKYEFSSRTVVFFLFNDLIYFIDLISGFFRAFYNFEEVLIVKKRYMTLNYLKGWFIFDLIEAFPYLIILNSKKESCDKNISHNFAYGNNLNYSLLLFKLFKIFKTFRNSAIKAMNKFLNKNNFFYDWKDVLAYIIVILCSLHIAGCYFIFLGKNIYPGWFAEGLQSESSIDIYIASIYYVVTTLTTVGYGDITVTTKHQRLFQIVLLIVGTLSYSWLLTYISNYIKKNNEKYIVYEEKMKILEEIRINYPNMSNCLYERISRYLRYNKSKYKYNIKYVLDSLPSSIQNNLIIEIYKPIIKNFLFFKYFDNSDFFVKIVTSMKPILSMKDDILVHEGDIIEDIIFIKKGRLILEADINLDGPKNNFDDQFRETNSFSNRINTLSNFQTTKIEEKNFYISLLNLTTKKSNTIKLEEKPCHKKQIKIIELRNNEHFGDVLMILNEKSPVTIKVKSKKAELLFLPKTDATEISNLYPNIWKKIVTKSLHNLAQIKTIIRKKIMLYCELNDIPFEEDFKNKISGLNRKAKFNNKRKNQNEKWKTLDNKYSNSTIKEVDESIYLSPKNSNTVISNKFLSRKKLSMKLDTEEKKKEENKYQEDNHNTSMFNVKRKLNLNNNANISNKSANLLKGNKIINGIILGLNKNNKNSFFEENKYINKENKSKINSNIINCKSEINNNNNTEIELENLNLNNKVEDDNLERVNEEIFLNEKLGINIINRGISMNNFDKNNFIIHQISKEKNEDLISRNNDKINKLLSGNNLSDTNIENVLIDNHSVHSDKGNKKINIYNNIVINNSNKNDNTNANTNYIKKNTFDILENSSADSFSINSTYENINKISKFKYANNKSLQEKVKKILVQPLIYSSGKKIQSAKNSLYKEETQKIKNTTSNKKNTMYHSAEKNKFENYKIEDIKTPKNTHIIKHKFINLFQENNDDTSHNNKKESHLRSAMDNLEDPNFYTQIKMKKGKSCKINARIKKNNNYEDKITKNIEKNKQNLNNPKEYFSILFNKILNRKHK